MDSYYVRCTQCQWGSYRQPGPNLTAKPCPKCGGTVEARNQRRAGQRGPAAGPITHGTRQGYQRGCYDPGYCPAIPSCAEVEREYQRHRYAERKRLVGA